MVTKIAVSQHLDKLQAIGSNHDFGPQKIEGAKWNGKYDVVQGRVKCRKCKKFVIISNGIIDDVSLRSPCESQSDLPKIVLLGVDTK